MYGLVTTLGYKSISERLLPEILYPPFSIEVFSFWLVSYVVRLFGWLWWQCYGHWYLPSLNNTCDGLFVRKISRILTSLVGSSTVCERLQPMIVSANVWLTAEGNWFPVTSKLSQLISGRLRSPQSHTPDFLSALQIFTMLLHNKSIYCWSLLVGL